MQITDHTVHVVPEYSDDIHRLIVVWSPRYLAREAYHFEATGDSWVSFPLVMFSSTRVPR